MNESQVKTYGQTKNGLTILRNVRLRPFAAIYKPEMNLNGKEQYSATVILDEEQFNYVGKLIRTCCKAEWKDKAEETFKSLKPDNIACRLMCDKRTGENFYGLKASRNAKDSKGNPIKAPDIRKRNRDKAEAGDSESPYPGCYVNLYVLPKVYDWNGNRGIKFDFVGMQFNRAGEAFSGYAQAADDDFENLAAEELDQSNEVEW